MKRFLFAATLALTATLDGYGPAFGEEVQMPAAWLGVGLAFGRTLPFDEVRDPERSKRTEQISKLSANEYSAVKQCPNGQTSAWLRPGNRSTFITLDLGVKPVLHTGGNIIRYESMGNGQDMRLTAYMLGKIFPPVLFQITPEGWYGVTSSGPPIMCLRVSNRTRMRQIVQTL